MLVLPKMEFSFSSGAEPEVFEDGDPEKKFDIRDPSDMANPPLRAKAPEGGDRRCRRSDEGGGGGGRCNWVRGVEGEGRDEG